MDRVLDWVPRHDPRSRAFMSRSVVERRPLYNRLWRTGPILDQGYEGACVGFGWTAEALATPVPVDLLRVKAAIPRDPHQLARHVYRYAQQIDEWEGESYEGTSVLAGAKVMRTIGTVREYRWAFGVQDVLDAIVRNGPVVLGTVWLDGMYEAPNGVLRPRGSVVGGHCYLAIGYRAYSPIVGGPSVVMQNSWGTSWGLGGVAHIAVADLADLLRQEGEACVPYRRSYGRLGGFEA